MFSIIYFKASPSFSIITALLAPLLTASSEILPLPLNKSKKTEFSTYGAIIEKRDSFTLSRVGLVSKPFLVFIILFLASPAIILILPPINK